MKKRVFGITVRLSAALLAVLMLLSVVGCSSDKNKNTNREKLVSTGDLSVEVWLYELLLSRMKAELARQKNDIGSEDYWNETVIAESGAAMTRAAACESSVLANTEKFLAAIKLAKDKGIKLTDEYYAEINEKIDFYVDYDGDGSREAFNAILEPFGVDIETLKIAYEYEYYVSLIQVYLYGSGGELISDGVKEDWFEKNYYKYKQIFIPTYYTEYEKDDNGQVAYFDPDTGEVAYDKENGSPEYDQNGNEVLDRWGTQIYLNSEGLPVYDTENGQPQFVTDENGTAVKYPYGEEKLAEIQNTVNTVYASVNAGAYAEFELLIEQYDCATDARAMYPNGYYISALESENFSDSHYVDLLNGLEQLQEGGFAKIQSSDGYYIFMKYKPTAGDYADETYQFLFTDFTSSLISELFDIKCRQEFDGFTVDEKALEHAKSIRNIGINYYY